MDGSFIGNMLKFSGLVGGGFPTNSLVSRPDTPATKDQLQREFQQAGSVSDPNIWAIYNQSLSRPVTFDSMLQLWDQMSSWDLIAATLLEIVDEATQTDSTSPGLLWYECNDPNFEEELNVLLDDLDVATLLPSQIWHVAGFGNSFEKLDYAPKEGVLGMSFVHPMDIRRFWLTRNRQCIGFRWFGHQPDKTGAYVGPDGQEIQRVGLNDGKNQVEDLFYPWDFMHFRRMYRMRMSEHGEPIFADAQGIYKKLRMAIDQMVVYRAQIQPDRYAINIDVQDQPPLEQLKTVQRWKQMLRKRMSFGEGNDQGGASEFNSFYNPMALDSILWIAQPKGFQHGIEKIAGTDAVPDVYDIELLINLFFAIIGMPRWWIMGQQDQENPASGRALMATDMRFMRKIKSIRQPIVSGYEWLAYFHAVLKGRNPAELDIRAKMPEIGSLEDQVKIEILNTQADVLTKLADVMERFQLPPDAWVEVIFKKYLNMPEDVINMIITSLPPQIQTEAEQRKLQAPKMAKLLEQITSQLGGQAEAAFIKRKLYKLADGVLAPEEREIRQRRNRYGTPNKVLGVTEVKANDLIVSSMGKNPLKLAERRAVNESLGGKASTKVTFTGQITETQPGDKATTNQPGYRQFMPS